MEKLSIANIGRWGRCFGRFVEAHSIPELKLASNDFYYIAGKAMSEGSIWPWWYSISERDYHCEGLHVIYCSRYSLLCRNFHLYLLCFCQVEGEIDKLSLEEAGFYNCVSVPDGAPPKVSEKISIPEEEVLCGIYGFLTIFCYE